jgi:mRNA-degrading endonuclease RelE of RelBE toxin-antitoxin system
MPLSPLELPKFRRQFKKLPIKLKDMVEDQIRYLLDNPDSGEKKTGDLFYIRVHKFKIGRQLYLIAYEIDELEGALYLYSIDTHENFYRDIKKYLRG